MTEEQKVVPKKKIEKPLNPLAAKPGQKYDSTKYELTKEYDGGKLKAEGDKTEGGLDVVELAKQTAEEKK